MSKKPRTDYTAKSKKPPVEDVETEAPKVETDNIQVPKVDEDVKPKIETPKAPPKQEVVKEVLVDTHTLNLRGGTQTTAKRLDYLHKGDKVQVLEVMNEEWYAVKTAAGLEGYIMSKFTKDA